MEANPKHFGSSLDFSLPLLQNMVGYSITNNVFVDKV